MFDQMLRNSFSMQNLTIFKENNQKKIFRKISQHKIPIPTENILFQCELSKKGKITKNKRFFLFFEDYCLYYKSKKAKFVSAILFYSFDIKIDWTYMHILDNLMGKPLGFKLLKGNLVEELLFIQENTYSEIRKVLVKKLNQCNFHKFYRAEKKIGEGNFAKVYLVTSLIDFSHHAVKAFSKDEVYQEENGKEALLNEIQIMRHISHHNIMQLEEVYETDRSIYMVIELLEGGNLSHHLRKNGPFPEQKTKSFLRSILNGVRYLHEKGIIHRDIKPENILFRTIPKEINLNNTTQIHLNSNLNISNTQVDVIQVDKTRDQINKNENFGEEELCIGDFGLSTYSGLKKFIFPRCGTPGFVAPEVINIKSMDDVYDDVCDEFSCGLVFHYMLFGKSIFSGKTHNELLNENRKCEFDFNGYIYKGLSPNARSFLQRLLEIDPKKRMKCQEALEHPFLKEDLSNEYSNEEEVDSWISTPNSSLQQRMSSFKSRNFCVKHITDININIYNTTLQTVLSNTKYSDENSMKLVSQTPCIDGFVNTSNRLEEYRGEAGKKLKRNDFSFLYTNKQREGREEVENNNIY